MPLGSRHRSDAHGPPRAIGPCSIGVRSLRLASLRFEFARPVPGQDGALARLLRLRGLERPEDLSQIGVLAAIVQRLPLSSDRYQLFLQGRQRVELVQMLQNEPYFEARLREIAPRPIPKTVKTEHLMNRALSLFEKLVESDSKYSNELLNILRMNLTEGPVDMLVIDGAERPTEN